MTPEEWVSWGLNREKEIFRSNPHQSKKDIVAQVLKELGKSYATYDRAKVIVQAASAVGLSEEEQLLAKEALDAMNESGKVTRSFNQVAHLVGRSPLKEKEAQEGEKRPVGRPPKAPAGNAEQLTDILISLTQVFDSYMGILKNSGFFTIRGTANVVVHLDNVEKTPELVAAADKFMNSLRGITPLRSQLKKGGYVND